MKERIQRVNELFKQEIAKIILREIDLPSDILITVTEVETSVDLQHTKVLISVLPEDKTKTTVSFLNKHIYEIQQMINKKLNMRPVPRIVFREDYQIAKEGRIEELLQEAKRNKKELED